ncbi:MAG: DUF488 domain-containing protein [Thermoguttaceae bacterium]|nr:DUF488 domain-containing protein [Thermoguttaceae bacterium]
MEPTQQTTVYTIGYEGITTQKLLKKLHACGVEQLLDIRAVPFSRKSGFSGDELRVLLTAVGIRYISMPGLGIPRQYRHRGTTAESLLALYEDVLLAKVPEQIDRAVRLCRARPTVLLCFEADAQRCHRGCLARRMESLYSFRVVHLRADFDVLPGF